MRERVLRELNAPGVGQLRLRARVLAGGMRIGSHRSARRGAGLEFAGHRAYVPGDDLRWLDHRAVLRQDRLLVKQFDTETDRALRLAIDASASMSFRGPQSSTTKFEYSALLCAALAAIATRSGDRVGLDIIGGTRHVTLKAAAGNPAFERIVAALEAAEPEGQFADSEEHLESLLARTAHRTAPGSLLVLVADLLDLSERAPEILATAVPGDRQLIVVQVLDPLERTFSFQGPIRLRSSEGDQEVETNAGMVRAEYLERLETLQASFRRALVHAGSGLVLASTADEPADVLRAILRTAERTPID